MADAVTTTGSMTLSQTAWERMAYFALRPELYFDPVVTVVPTAQSMPGSSVTWTFINDLAIANTPLSETTDVNAVALSDTTVTLTLQEYGNAVVTTAKLHGTSFLAIDPIVANEIGWNAGVSIDTVARDALYAGAGTTVYPRTSNTKSARNTLISSNTTTPYQGDLLNAATLRYVYAKLVGTNVKTVNGSGMYVLYAHPDQVHDLRAETGSGSWRLPREYQDMTQILNGEVGMFEGFRIVETPRAPVLTDAGGTSLTGSGGGTGATGGTDVYRAVAVGDEALAKIHSTAPGLGMGPMPSVYPGPVTDHLRRLTPVSWYWLGAYGGFRSAAAYVIETASSIGSN